MHNFKVTICRNMYQVLETIVRAKNENTATDKAFKMKDGWEDVEISNFDVIECEVINEK